MDWLKELLKKLGVEESKLDEAIGEINKELPKHFVPKSQYNDLSETKKKLDKEVADRDKQIEDIKKSAGDNAALQQQITKLQDDNKTAKEKYEAEVKDLKLNTALKLSLTGQAHDPDIVASLIDKSKIELDDTGTVKGGLDDQLKVLRESKAFLFVEKSDNQFRGAKPQEGSGGSGGSGGGSGEEDIGKRLADMNAKSNENLDKARNSYFE